MPLVGQKWDTGKASYWRAMRRFPDAIAGACRAADYGFEKYCIGKGIPDDNWKYVPNMEQRYFDALIRHWLAVQAGEDLDPESELRHWDHIAWNALALAQVHHERLDVAELSIGDNTMSPYPIGAPGDEDEEDTPDEPYDINGSITNRVDGPTPKGVNNR